ncbi:MAG: hypothetical protein JWQ11_4467 [Rhizobacter sp.]|nr:hypothetical protein [Rhizobacter sp.]
MADHIAADQRSVITRFWVAAFAFWPAMYIVQVASGSWIVGTLAGLVLMLTTVALVWRMTFGNWVCLSVFRKGKRR